MKTKMILLTATTLLSLLIVGVGCEDDLSKNELITTPAIVPKSKNQIEHIFELKYGKQYNYVYNSHNLSFSIVDVVDSVLIDCHDLELVDPIYPLSTMKIHTYLQIIIDKKDKKLLKVNSKECGALTYNHKNDIEEISAMIEKWNEYPVAGYTFEQEFSRYFGSGTLLSDKLVSVYMARAYPRKYQQAERSLYKFIFILSTREL